MEVLTMGAELFHAGGRTDATKLIVGFRNLANAPFLYCIPKLAIRETFIIISMS